MTLSPKDLFTKLFAPTITLSPSLTPPDINTLAPIQQLFPISISRKDVIRRLFTNSTGLYVPVLI